MRRHRLPGPDGTHFLSRAVANGENKIHFWSAGLCELLPALAAQVFGGRVRHFNQLERLGSHHSRRVTSRAVSCENGLAFTVENGFSHDGARGISRAQE